MNVILKIKQHVEECCKLMHFINFVKVIKCELLPFFNKEQGMLTKHKIIISYLENNFVDIIEKYKYTSVPQKIISDDAPIWVCWFQGENNMPPLVKLCLNQLRKFVGKHPVIILTDINIPQYVEIPEFVYTRVRLKQLSLAHYSDILRNKLLAECGGIWLDATIFITHPLDSCTYPFFTVKQDIPDDGKFVSAYRWTGFCMGGVKDNPLNSFVYDMLIAYNKKENKLIDYFLIDYVIAVGYNNVPSIKTMIDQLPYSNPQLYYLQDKMEEDYDEKGLKLAFNDTFIFKLNRRIVTPYNKNALYYHLIDKQDL